MNNYRIAITTGDKLGIGKEIVQKALSIIKPDKKDVLIIGEKIDVDYPHYLINEDNNGVFCYKSLEFACSLAKKGLIKGIVTAPVSKLELNQAGYNFLGQTEVIESLLSREKKAQMLFIAQDLKVMLLSRHCALLDINLTINDVVLKIEVLNNFLVQKCRIKNPKIALCAFNPHCGEGGILGREEIEILNPAVSILREKGINISNPISADGLFSRVGKNYLNNKPQEQDAIVSCYHDQGLCPLKALCFDKAVNTTIGLEVIRTSPSSGTAYDIANKGIADPSSMVEAIKLALSLS